MPDCLGRCEWLMPEFNNRRCLAGAFRVGPDGKNYCDSHPGKTSGDPHIDMARAQENRALRLQGVGE